MERVHNLRGYSSYPYTGKPESLLERRARQFFFSFKNGRSYEWRGPPRKHLSFEQVLSAVARSALRSPPLQVASGLPLLLIPVPRSGNSRESFGQGAHEWPNLALAQQLAQLRPHFRVEQLLDRQSSVPCASDSKRRPTVGEHLDSLKVTLPQEFFDSRIVLIDDLITRGTQAIACMVALHEQGHRGPIEGYFVSQTIGPKAGPEDRKKHLIHELTWRPGANYPMRVEVGPWQRVS